MRLAHTDAFRVNGMQRICPPKYHGTPPVANTSAEKAICINEKGTTAIAIVPFDQCKLICRS